MAENAEPTAMPNDDDLREAVFRELKKADLSKLTAKTLRLAVEKTSGYRKNFLKPKKAEISEFIDEYFHNQPAGAGGGEDGAAMDVDPPAGGGPPEAVAGEVVEEDHPAPAQDAAAEAAPAPDAPAESAPVPPDAPQDPAPAESAPVPAPSESAPVPDSADAHPKPPVEPEKLREMVFAFLKDKDLEQVTAKIIRYALEEQLGLPKNGLKKCKELINHAAEEFMEIQEPANEEKEEELSPEELKRVALIILERSQNDDEFSMSGLRKEMEKELGLPAKSLKPRKNEIKQIATTWVEEILRKQREEEAKAAEAPSAPPPAGAPAAPRGRSQQEDAVLGLGDNAADFDVFSKLGRQFNVMLNQTDLAYGQRGHNKFYVIQVLKHKTAQNVFKVITKWGRVGNNPQSSEKVYHSEVFATDEFEAKFYDKTRNEWGARTFVKHPGKYTMIDVLEEEDDIGVDEASLGNQQHRTQLPQDVFDVMKRICARELQHDALRDMNLDPHHFPLGKLSKGQIKRGYKALRAIAQEINRQADPSVPNDRVKLTNLSSQFYTVIPHDFGMNLPPPIDSRKRLSRKIRLLETLSEMEIAGNILKKTTTRKHILDHYYASLNCDITPLVRGENMVRTIKDAIQGTHAPTHSGYTLEVEQVFEVTRRMEEANFSAFQYLPNRKLLWHGSRMTNWIGILSQGLRVAPRDAPKTGYMFGKGIYFADLASKSANYIRANAENPHGLLILCDVALGRMHTETKAAYHHRVPVPCHSVFAKGKTIPDPDNTEFVGGSELAMGPCVTSAESESQLLYNEYVVYDPAQVQMRYLVKVKFNFVGNAAAAPEPDA